MKRIYFFTYGTKDDLKYQDQLAENIVIVPKMLPLPSLLYMFALPFLAHAECRDSDIFKTNQMKGGLAAMIAAHVYRKKLIVRCGYEWLNSSIRAGSIWWKLLIIKLIEKVVYRNANHIILSAHNIKDFVLERFSVPEKLITVIPNYIDTVLFSPKQSTKHQKTIYFVGRLSAEKNLFNLITALSGLDFNLVVFGSGILDSDLKLHAESENVRVEFRGNISNDLLPEELNKAEIFILPSLFEGNPKALLEAMACGLPVIATNVVGNQELISHKENGYLCETSVESIREAIVAVTSDTLLMSTMGTGARKTILEGFSIEHVLKSEMNIYSSL
ncbi:MAG: glycosyltransferase family 4 protein [Parcubacteria group bacterium]|nr:glycosyltransferase family 4 protein [Parcubacteria group bacterium]